MSKHSSTAHHKWDQGTYRAHFTKRIDGKLVTHYYYIYHRASATGPDKLKTSDQKNSEKSYYIFRLKKWQNETVSANW